MHNTVRSYSETPNVEWTKEDKKPKMYTKERPKYNSRRNLLEMAQDALDEDTKFDPIYYEHIEIFSYHQDR